MPVDPEPQVADEVAAFGQGASKAASISYDVPLPGAYSFQRIVPIEVPADSFAQAGTEAGISLVDLGVIKEEDGQVISIDGGRLSALYQKVLPAMFRPSRQVASETGVDVVELVQPSIGEPSEASGLLLPRLDAEDIALGRENIELQGRRRGSFLEKLAEHEAEEAQAQLDAGGPPVIQIPAPGLGESVQKIDYDVSTAGIPQLALVEIWQISAFLGDYGLGRTLQTFSLLPGERTTISVETWRTDSATREDASSVLDSSDTAAQTRFTSALTFESGSAFQDQGGWAMSVGAKVGAGVNLGIVQASASVETGFSANHQEARQQFSSSVAQTGQDHASQVNASRRQSVESTSTSTAETGTSQATVREIVNTNMRRVLNFVFRELNQTYETTISLRDVRVAFYNGKVGSAEIVALADLRRLVQKYVVPDQQEEVARAILAMVTQCLDNEGTPQTMLQVGTRNAGAFDWQDATLSNDGGLDFDDSPLGGQYSWRIKPGAIGQADDSPQVRGVVTARDTIVLRTDNVAVEALLGQADALDPYATELQAVDLEARRAEIEARKVGIERIEKALAIIDAQAPAAQTDAFEKMLGDHPEIAVVPAAAVTENGPNP